jgi:hypothetical protein
MSSDTAEYTLSDNAVLMLLDPADCMSLDTAKFIVSDNAYVVSPDTVNACDYIIQKVCH